MKLSDVKGNVSGFGLPASKDMRPGRDSNGKRPRTEDEISIRVWLTVGLIDSLTWARLSPLCSSREECIIVACWQGFNLGRFFPSIRMAISAQDRDSIGMSRSLYRKDVSMSTMIAIVSCYKLVFLLGGHFSKGLT